MPGNDLLIVVPTRGRPHNIRRLIQAWEDTNAFDWADLIIAFDNDDSKFEDYCRVLSEDPHVDAWLFSSWRPMVNKLNIIAADAANGGGYEAIGFMGDDHIPRTQKWAQRFLFHLRSMEVGIVYGNDLQRKGALPTQWVMTSNIVRILGRMVPAKVDHQFSDRSVLDLGDALKRIRYLPRVIIEHRHYRTGKVGIDDTYRSVNNKQLWQSDKTKYQNWKRHRLRHDVQAVRDMIIGKALGSDSGTPEAQTAGAEPDPGTAA